MNSLPEEALRELAKRGEAVETDMGWEAFPARPSFQPPLPEQALEEAEGQLGFALPPVVRQLYGRVANGGFGPGYGLLGLLGGARSDIGRDAVEEYLAFRLPDPEDPGYEWPERLLPVCHWGCSIYSCVDCRDRGAPVIRFDPNPVDDDWSIAFAPEDHSFGAWLQAWLESAARR